MATMMNLGMGGSARRRPPGMPLDPNAPPGVAPAGPANLGFGGGAPAGPAAPNPYLQQQGQAIIGDVTRNLQNNILPGINSGAQLAGGFGGSRQGIAQGLAIQGATRDTSNALAGLYGNAYESDANRTNSMGIANVGAAASRYASDNSLAGTKYGADSSLAANTANNTTQRYGIDTSAGTAAAANATNLHGIDTSATTQRYGVDTAANTAAQGNQTQRYGIDTGAATNRYGTDANLGMNAANNATNQRGQDIAANTQRYGTDASIGINHANNATNRYGIDASAGTARYTSDNALTGQRYGIDSNANLGLGSLALGNRNADTSQALAGNQIFNSGIDNTIRVGDAMYTNGARELNAPALVNTNYNNQLAGLLGTTGTTQQQGSGSGGGLAGAIGGAIGGLQLGQILAGGTPTQRPPGAPANAVWDATVGAWRLPG